MVPRAAMLRMLQSKSATQTPTPIKSMRFARVCYGSRRQICRSPPSFFYETSKQNNPDSYDSVSATNAAPSAGLAHYEVFDIAQPLTDEIKIYSLNANYAFHGFDVTSSTSYWSRFSVQKEEASEAFKQSGYRRDELF